MVYLKKIHYIFQELPLFLNFEMKRMTSQEISLQCDIAGIFCFLLLALQVAKQHEPWAEFSSITNRYVLRVDSALKKPLKKFAKLSAKTAESLHTRRASA